MLYCFVRVLYELSPGYIEVRAGQSDHLREHYKLSRCLAKVSWVALRLAACTACSLHDHHSRLHYHTSCSLHSVSSVHRRCLLCTTGEYSDSHTERLRRSITTVSRQQCCLHRSTINPLT
jgi:hypothetical protein